MRIAIPFEFMLERSLNGLTPVPTPCATMRRTYGLAATTQGGRFLAFGFVQLPLTGARDRAA